MSSKSRHGGSVSAVDIFCGAGGLTSGLRRAGVCVTAGIDVDPACAHPFVSNNGAFFIEADIRDVTAPDLEKLYLPGTLRLLAGCAPCRPFSRLRRGVCDPQDNEWSLLAEFSRLVRELIPEFVTMENVPGLGSKPMFPEFVSLLRRTGYHVDYRSIHCPRLGLPQNRRRLEQWTRFNDRADRGAEGVGENGQLQNGSASYRIVAIPRRWRAGFS